MTKKPLRVGDKIKLISPGYGDPRGECVVIANQRGNLAWFAPNHGGACFVARSSEVKVMHRKKFNTDRVSCSHPADFPTVNLIGGDTMSNSNYSIHKHLPLLVRGTIAISLTYLAVITVEIVLLLGMR